MMTKKVYYSSLKVVRSISYYLVLLDFFILRLFLIQGWEMGKSTFFRFFFVKTVSYPVFFAW